MHKVINVVLFLTLPLLLCLCSTQRVVVEHVQVVHTKDSIALHDSTVYYHVPIEVVKEVSKPLDTLRMETSLAVSTAYLDTLTTTLKGTLRNKEVSVPVKIQWKEKIVTRDSIVTQEVPVYITKEKKVKHVPKLYTFLFGILAVLAIPTILRIIMKFTGYGK